MMNRKQFMVQVEKRASGCWEWTGARFPFGHGRCTHFGRTMGTHRVAWLLFRGGIPTGKCVLHKCDNPPCVNPDHLYIGTKADNVRDAETRGRARHPAGDANGSRTKPHRRAHGERNGSVTHPGIRKGARNGRAKLSGGDVQNIRMSYAAGARQTDLAETYGVSQSTISSIVRLETWQ